MILSITGFLILVIVIAILLHKMVVIVHSGEVKILERFGNYVKTLEPGLHLVIPIIYGIREKVSTRQTPLVMEPFNVITKENASIKVQVSLKYHVSNVVDYVYNNENSEQSVMLDCQSNLRGIIGNMELNEVLNGTESINNSLFKEISSVSTNYGVQVDRVNIGEITPSVEVQKSMDKLITASRDKQAMVTEAEGKKQQTIAEAEGNAQQIEIDATAQAKQVNIAAEAEANRIKTIADAKAQQVKVINDAINNSNMDDKVIQYLGLQAFEKAADGPNNTFLLPTNLTKLANIPAAKKLWDATEEDDPKK